ncbi:hypothetical protein Tco_0293914 [Tanacetum coccineum]
MRHGLYVTIACYVLLAIVVDRGTRSVPLFVVLEHDRLRALMDCRSSQDLEVQVKLEIEIPCSCGVYFITACSYSTDASKELMKAQVTTNNQAFTVKKSMSMSVQLPRAQDGERTQVDDQRLDLADDLKEAQYHISSTITSHKTKTTTSMQDIT